MTASRLFERVDLLDRNQPRAALDGMLDTITVGDARILAQQIPDESIDIVFTDPPYLREHLEDGVYQWLSETALRVLRPGGYCFAYASGEHYPTCLNQMLSGGLTYFWTFALLHNGGYPRLWNKRLMSGYKPVLVFTKGKPRITRWMSTVGAVSADKRFHAWGQGAGFALKTIAMLTSPGDVVLEPFTGGGTVPAVCKQLGRHFVAFEIDEIAAQTSLDRLRQDVLPLDFEPTPDQLSLEAISD